MPNTQFLYGSSSGTNVNVTKYLSVHLVTLFLLILFVQLVLLAQFVDLLPIKSAKIDSSDRRLYSTIFSKPKSLASKPTTSRRIKTNLEIKQKLRNLRQQNKRRMDFVSEDQEFDNLFSDHVLTYEPIGSDSSNFPNQQGKSINDHCIKIQNDLDKDLDSQSSTTNFEFHSKPDKSNLESTPKEIFLPIEIDDLIPKSTSTKSHLNEFHWNITTTNIENDNDNEWIKLNNNNNNMDDLDEDFLNKLIQAKEDAEDYETRSTMNRSTISTVPLRTTTTTTTTTTSTATRKPSLLRKISSKIQTSAISLPISQEAERRLLMAGPFRRLLLAYYAPRILRLQFSMLLHTLIGEVTRKIFDPLIRQATSKSTTAAPSVATAIPSLTKSLLPDPNSLNQILSLLQNSNLGNLNLNQLQQQLTPIATTERPQVPASLISSSMSAPSAGPTSTPVQAPALSAAPAQPNLNPTPNPNPNLNPTPNPNLNPNLNPNPNPTSNSMMNLDISNLNLNDPELKTLLNSLGGMEMSSPLVRNLLDMSSMLGGIGGGGSSISNLGSLLSNHNLAGSKNK